MRINHTAVLARVARVRGHDYTEGFAWACIMPYEQITELPTFGECCAPGYATAWLALVAEHVADHTHVTLVLDGPHGRQPTTQHVWCVEAPTSRQLRQVLRLRPRETWSAWVERKYGVPLVPADQALACALAVWARKAVRTTEHVTPTKKARR